MTPQEIAKAVIKLYGRNSKRWTRGWFARSESRRHVNINSPKAVCWCIVGAAWRVNGALYPSEFTSAVEKIIGGESVSYWNDDPDTTFADVRRVLQQIANGEP